MAAARILVDESDAVTARFVTSLLRQRGFEVLHPAKDEPLAEAARSHRPDLIVTDLRQPSEDTGLALQGVRSDEELSDIPLIVLSLRDREEDIVRGFEDGADDYVVKPFRARELIARIERLLGRARRTR